MFFVSFFQKTPKKPVTMYPLPDEMYPFFGKYTGFTILRTFVKQQKFIVRTQKYGLAATNSRTPSPGYFSIKNKMPFKPVVVVS